VLKVTTITVPTGTSAVPRLQKFHVHAEPHPGTNRGAAVSMERSYGTVAEAAAAGAATDAAITGMDQAALLRTLRRGWGVLVRVVFSGSISFMIHPFIFSMRQTSNSG